MDVTDGEQALLARGLPSRSAGTVEQDEDGAWSGHAQLRPGVGANGEGDTANAAVADLREALEALIAEFGAPEELTVMVDVA